jgi:hypothetical protein
LLENGIIKISRTKVSGLPYLEKLTDGYFMKKYVLPLFAIGIFLSCQKELSALDETLKEENETAVRGRWMFVSFTDEAGNTVTNANPCWADNTLELKENNTAVISQGECIETPQKPKDVEFSWRFITEDVADLGGDTVKITVHNDTALQFHRISKTFLEYKWKR